jgi:hypothetical protein
VSGWVSRFDVPEQVTLDQGRQFCSSIWDALSCQLGIKMRFTTAYHPQSNGLVKSFHRWLKEALRARLAGADWPQHLPWVLLGLRAAPREDSGISAAELVYGCPLSLPGQFITAAEPPPDTFVSQLRSSLPCVSDRTGCSPPAAPPPQALRTASFVYVRLPPPVAGSGASLSRTLPRQGPRQQILRGGGRRLSNGGLSRPPQAASREGPAVAGSDPSSRPASSVV